MFTLRAWFIFLFLLGGILYYASNILQSFNTLSSLGTKSPEAAETQLRHAEEVEAFSAFA
jgi:hypothetical protein